MPRKNRPAARHRHTRAHVREAADRKRAQRLDQLRRGVGWSGRSQINLDEVYGPWFAWGLCRAGFADQLHPDERRILDRILRPHDQRSATIEINARLARELGRRFDRLRGRFHYQGFHVGEVVRLDQRLSYGRFDYEPDWSIFECDGPTRAATKARWRREFIEHETVDDAIEDAAERCSTRRYTISKGVRGRYLGLSR